MAMGIPLINSIYDDSPLLGSYTLPLLIWHPMQLFIGSALAPHLMSYVVRNQESCNDTSIEIEDGGEDLQSEILESGN
eukprot:CAMPEP_0184863806 /NCGR_PEP_ID=MMETSP0580-20130426/12581_1 /TAXON_ID=1118495 /ORGANISM="Dactyliosolen fragilissimus" /LENGTH=77 /DNA_ID=CAMNT_0027362345 /DNA_START=944 /DNA_END=1177 /DNA_ORIENTATION=-